MCLAVIAINARPGLPLLLAANRDEFHARPALPAAPRAGQPDIVAGRDLAGGGTWLGVTRQGRYALLTNFRDPSRVLADAPSRGGLVQAFLQGQDTPLAYLGEVLADGDRYNGFNLIVGDADGAWYASNRHPDRQALRLPDGVHGLSNHLLDTPWPKVVRTRDAVRQLLSEPDAPAPDALFAILADRRRPTDDALPDTGVGLSRERMLSPPFITSPDHGYGTRCTSVLMGDPGQRLTFHELQYDSRGAATTRVDWRLTRAAPIAAIGNAVL